MNDYQKEQWAALLMARNGIDRLDATALTQLRHQIKKYIEFRGRVDDLLNQNFNTYCTLACYQNRRSACCSKDGIIVFWADVVVNALCSAPKELDRMAAAIQRPVHPDKCIFLTETGCCWKMRPLVCAMFLCDGVIQSVFSARDDLRGRWGILQDEAKGFRWPDRPVLFDFLERYFLDLGITSTLMHINTSPGLLRVKRSAGLIDP